MNQESSTYLDGNAAAGELRDIFAFDITAAVGQCNGCRKTGPMAETQLYAQAPGMVIRCAHCENVLIRIVKSPAQTWAPAGPQALTAIE